MRGAMLVLDVNGETVKAFQFIHSGKSLKLTSFGECAVRNGKPGEEFLRGLAGKAFPGGVYILFPSEEAVIKTLYFPLSDEEKISRVIRFEAEKFLPYPVEDAVIDFIVVDKSKNGSNVLAAAAGKNTLEFYIGLFSEADFYPRAVVPDLVCIPELVESSAPFMLIFLSGRALKICIYKNRAPRFIRTIRPGTEKDGTELIEIIEKEAGMLAGAFSLTEPDCALEDAYIAGGSLRLEDAAPRLSEKLGFKVSVLGVPEGLKNGLKEPEASRARGRLEPAAALALAAASGKKLLNLQERKEKTARRESPVLAAALGALMLVFIFLSVFVRLEERMARLSGIREEISRAVDETFSAPELAGRSGIEIISILRERTQLRGAAAGALGEIGSGRVLDALRELVISFPGEEGINITGVRIDRGVCYLDGRAESFRQVEGVLVSILGSEYFEDARIARAQVDGDRGGVVFRIEVFFPEGV